MTSLVFATYSRIANSNAFSFLLYCLEGNLLMGTTTKKTKGLESVFFMRWIFKFYINIENNYSNRRN